MMSSSVRTERRTRKRGERSSKPPTGVFGNRMNGPVKNVIITSGRSNRSDISFKPYSARGGKSDVRSYVYSAPYTPKYGETDIDVLNNVPCGNGFSYISRNDAALTHNKCLSKLKDELEPISSFFEDWYERQQAYRMLISAGIGMLSFLRDIKDPKRLARRFGKWAVKKKSLPETWLAYNFGVKPLIGTVENAIDLLSRNPPPLIVDASSSTVADYADPPGEFRIRGKVTYTVKMGVRVTGFNANLALAASLGLDKPLTNAWSVVPWGWAVDYFVNVSELLSNFEPFITGVTISDSYETVYERFKGSASTSPSIDGYHAWCNNMEGWNINRRVPADLKFHFAHIRPRIMPETNARQVANLFSAIALSIKEK